MPKGVELVTAAISAFIGPFEEVGWASLGLGSVV